MAIRSMMMALAISGLACGTAVAQPAKDPTKQIKKEVQKTTDAVKKELTGQPGQPSEAEMKAWADAMTPGENHKRLDAFVGEWNVKSVTQMAPDAPKEETTGHCSNKWMLDGRFLLQEYSGTMMNMPFKGFGVWGYDNVKKQYVGNWMDSSSTGIMNSTGSYDEGSKSWTMKGSFQDPSGKVIPTRQVTKIVDANSYTFDFYMAGPDGKEFKSMTLTYTRAKGGDTKPATDSSRTK